MKTDNVENITFESSTCTEYIRKIIIKAMQFLSYCIKIDKSYFDLHCIISQQYENDVKKYHGKSEKEDNSNAIYIPPFYQKSPGNKSILIINWSKIKNAFPSFIISVFVHEFVHYLDFLLCHEIEEKYGKIFALNFEPNTFEDRIGGFFYMRTEMRAKYFQEKYECSIDSSTEHLRRRIKECATKPTSEFDFYNIAQLTGQVRCWKEFSQNNKSLLSYIAPLEKLLNKLFSKNPPSECVSIFERDSFFKL